MIHPFKDGMLQQACPMSDVLGAVAEQLNELKMLKETAAFEMNPS
jgi:adenylate cyclase